MPNALDHVQNKAKRARLQKDLDGIRADLEKIGIKTADVTDDDLMVALLDCGKVAERTNNNFITLMLAYKETIQQYGLNAFTATCQLVIKKWEAGES
jgi:hypothetical protein